MWTDTHKNTHIHLPTHTNAHICILAHTHTFIYTHMHEHTQMHIFTHLHTCIHTHAKCKLRHTFAHLYTCARTHTVSWRHKELPMLESQAKLKVLEALSGSASICAWNGQTILQVRILYQIKGMSPVHPVHRCCLDPLSPCNTFCFAQGILLDSHFN